MRGLPSEAFLSALPVQSWLGTCRGGGIRGGGVRGQHQRGGGIRRADWSALSL